MSLRPLQAKPFSFVATKLESDAERCCGRDRCHSGGFLLRIMPPSWHPVPACTPRLRCRRTILSCSSDKNRRRNYSSLPRRKLESDADLVAATATAGETILLSRNKEQNRTQISLPLRPLQAKLFFFAETKLESDAEVVVAEPQLSCSDSQIDPLKSRITAAFGLFPRKSLHRFASLGLKSRIDARKRG